MKTAHRIASRAKRAPLPTTADLPKFWRPKITTGQKLDCRVIHWDLIDRFTTGTATVVDLWDWMETGFTYSQLMRLLAQDGTEFTTESMTAIADQLNAYEAIAARYRRTGRVGFSAPELLTARAAAAVFDGLVEMDRHGYADQAARWSIEQMGKGLAGFVVGAGV